MKIRVKQATIVKPAEETPRHSLWLSNLDLIQVRFHMGMHYFYNPCSSSNLPNTQSLIDALSKVLVLFYPAAGRLQKDKNGRLEVRCNGEGVLLVEAETDSTVKDIGFLTQSLDLTQLVPTLDYSGDISSLPLLLFQVTYFKCGAICIGSSIHHTFGAAPSLEYFTEAWSRTARGLPVKLEPIFDRTVLRARDPPSPFFPHTEYQPPPFHNPPVKSLVYRSNPESDSAVASLKLTRLQLKALRAKAEIADSKFSTYELLVAHIWRCACFANEDLSGEHLTRLHIIIDGRSRLRPKLPQGYIGNTLFHARPISLRGDFRREPFSTTVERVHGEIRKMDNEYLRSAIDYLERHPDLDQLVLGEGNPIFSCAANFCIVGLPKQTAYELDFGWGRPFYERSSHLNEGKGFVARSLDEEGSFLVFMCLKKTQLANLRFPPPRRWNHSRSPLLFPAFDHWVKSHIEGERMVERTMSLGVGGHGETSGVRETMWAQQELLQKINQELDAEREASSSAASEALSMILRLQGEKSALEMEASQYKRLAEEKMSHAETSLALFEDLIYHKEMEIASLEFQVQAYRCKLLSLGSSDPAVIENKFPENLIFFGETSRVNQKMKMKRNLSSPFHGMAIERSLLLSDSNGESFEEKKGLESSLSPREDLNAYWEQIRRIDDHVREISDSRDAPREPKFPLLRRESMSHALVSQVSNTILESAKSDVSSIMEMMKNPDRFSVKDASSESPIRSPNVQDIFEVPRTKNSLTIISEEEELEQRNVRGKMVSSNHERKVSKLPRDTSIKTDNLSLLKEIREQLNVMQSEIRCLRSDLHQTQHVSHRKEEDQALNSIHEAMIHFWL